MKRFALILLGAVTLMQSALSMAAQPIDSKAKPSSFVPHIHSKTHVYGAPIHPAIVGHSKNSRQKPTHKKLSSSPNK